MRMNLQKWERIGQEGLVGVALVTDVKGEKYVEIARCVDDDEDVVSLVFPLGLSGALVNLIHLAEEKAREGK